ncbi:XRE family transcriptional regulator [Pseudidiomarina sp. CB1]|uniref:helix-turn-helix domain-containing protein n=1 Tax=Pseudidiomarina sp. CB1 TaxID=2972484 RepID=UPI00216145A2|nr:XRE family transcriptional regulator [Pseudidiomarina sp. CB1]
MFAERFVRARKASGLSMQALADKVGLSANAIKKYEHGDAMPSSSNLMKLSKALNVRSEYFFRPTKIEVEGIEYRKRASISQKILNKIRSDVLDQAERWYELLDLFPDSAKPIANFELPQDLPESITDYEEIDSVADCMREHWQLGLNPVQDMVDTFESRGLMVILTYIETDKKFDGLAGTIKEQPLIVISGSQAGDRQRFTLAHELGHLVLRDRLANSIDEEKACDRFAGAFLLPTSAVKRELGEKRSQLESRELYMLKGEYGISMAGITIRAQQCRIITSGYYAHVMRYFSKQGWRKQEPGDAYPSEQTFLFKQLVYRALSEEYIGESKAAELLGMSLASFHKERKLEVTGDSTTTC